MDKISLSASMRSNLLSLQNISKQVDSTQNKLSTGKKVNSAIDNPSSYYTARSLTNRANDLDALLDSMGQAVSTIKAATEALENAADFLEQAKAVATQTLEDTSGFLSDQPIAARVSNETELLDAINSGKQGLIVIEGSITLSENQVLNLQDGQSLVGANYLDPNKGGKDELIFNMTDGSIEKAVNMANNSSVSNLNITFNASSRSHLFYASNKQGVNFSNLNIDFVAEKDDTINRWATAFYFDNTEATISDKINIKAKGDKLCGIWGYKNANIEISENSQINIEIDGDNIGSNSRSIMSYDNSEINIRSGSVINSSIKNSELGLNIIVYRGGRLNIENAIMNATNNCNDGYGFDINGGDVNISQKSIVNFKCEGKNFYSFFVADSSQENKFNVKDNSEIHIEQSGTNSTAFTVRKPASGINTVNFASGTKISVKDHNNPANDGYWKLDKDWEKEIDSTGTDFSINSFASLDGFTSTGETYQMFDDLPEINFDTVVWDRPEVYEDSLQYASIISQYDSLIKDASYKGVNLLQGQDLKVTFNEGRTAWLDVIGKDASSAALGLTTLEWNSKADVEKSIEELTNAMNQIRSMSSELGSYYNIVLSRQDFTENLINVLEEGADKLTLADMNEESANMLALQTRQQLAINSLSLASQAAQGILRLF